jgi:hypothetical protein
LERETQTADKVHFSKVGFVFFVKKEEDAERGNNAAKISLAKNRYDDCTTADYTLTK